MFVIEQVAARFGLIEVTNAVCMLPAGVDVAAHVNDVAAARAGGQSGDVGVREGGWCRVDVDAAALVHDDDQVVQGGRWLPGDRVGVDGSGGGGKQIGWSNRSGRRRSP